jgi:Ca2+-binding RTX toxin-like protein
MRRIVLLLATTALTLLVTSGVALAVNKIGTNGPDTLRGTNAADKLVGGSGNDRLYALAGQDNLLGGPGKDIVLGGDLRDPFGGDKNLVGGRGNDVVFGGLGSDNIVGEAGSDYIFDVRGKDQILGGGGADLIDANDGFGDRISCGAGSDEVIFERRLDIVSADCESRHPTSGVEVGLISWFCNHFPRKCN